MTREEREKAIELLDNLRGMIEDNQGNDYDFAIQKAIEAIKQEPCEDIMAIHIQGLDEEIRCTMCTNPMRSDRGCDGGCMFDEDMYKKVMDTIRNRIVSSVTPTHKKGHWIMNSDFPDEIICSCCNTNYDMWFWEQGTMNYCPHCGAEMQEVEHE